MNDHKNILAIETSSNICGIAYITKGICVGSIENDLSKKHAEILPEYYLKLQKETDFVLDEIDAVAVSIGPGSFTGLRVGLSFAKGIAFSKGLPIIPISTMMSLAYVLKESLPEMGIIYSHARRVFYQNIKWDHDIPHPNDDISVLEWDDLLKKISTLPKKPNAIPYITSYYEKKWGFCTTHNQKKYLFKKYFPVELRFIK